VIKLDCHRNVVVSFSKPARFSPPYVAIYSSDPEFVTLDVSEARGGWASVARRPFSAIEILLICPLPDTPYICNTPACDHRILLVVCNI
jgi:hypothetical protein